MVLLNQDVVIAEANRGFHRLDIFILHLGSSIHLLSTFGITYSLSLGHAYCIYASVF